MGRGEKGRGREGEREKGREGGREQLPLGLNGVEVEEGNLSVDSEGSVRERGNQVKKRYQKGYRTK